MPYGLGGSPLVITTVVIIDFRLDSAFSLLSDAAFEMIGLFSFLESLGDCEDYLYDVAAVDPLEVADKLQVQLRLDGLEVLLREVGPRPREGGLHGGVALAEVL